MAKTKNNPKGSGRKRIDIDWELAQNLYGLHCTDVEVASILGIALKTLNGKYNKEKKDEVKKLGRAKATVSLKRAAYNNAVKHNNPQMQKYMLNNMSNFSEKQELETTLKETVTIVEGGDDKERLEE